MHDHGQILELAAAAIDFELDPAERARLDAELEGCPLCRRQASAMRATATILARPSDIGTPSRVRDVVMGAALRGGSRSPGWRPLLVASLSLVVVVGGAAIFVGNRGTDTGPAASPPAPSPLQTAVALASPTPSATPSSAPTDAPSPLPTETSAPGANPTPDPNGPLRPGDVAAMVSDGRLVIRTAPGTGPESAVYKTRIFPGERVLVLDGPVAASGYSWFHVRLGAIEGWAAAAGLDGQTWLAPVRNGLIAFVRQATNGDPEGIYTIAPDGSAAALLSASPGMTGLTELTWSPDGHRLAFVASPAGSVNSSSEVFVIDADGSNLVQVTQNDVNDDSPSWSPDGTRLAVRVAQVDPSAPGDFSVVVVPVDQPGVTVLGPGSYPVWSPDGSQIAMTVSDGGASRIWVQAPDGTGRRQVSTVTVAAAQASWSPDGLGLVFSSSGVFVVEVATGSIVQLAAEPGVGLTWSATGQVVFSTTESAAPGVYVVNADGSGLGRIAGDETNVSAPAWSPDGRLLLVGDGAAGSAIVVVDPDSGALTTILNDGLSSSPAWQPRLP